MESTNHTPGPWSVDRNDPFWVTADKDGLIVADASTADRNDKTCLANAQLIASTPDLLAERDRLRDINAELVAALTDAEFLLRKLGVNWKEAGSMAESCHRSAQDARTALAKAKGE